MARVAVAYVEVRPDLDLFAGALRDELNDLGLAEKIKIEPDLTGFEKATRAAIGKASKNLAPKIGPKVDANAIAKSLKDSEVEVDKAARALGKIAGESYQKASLPHANAFSDEVRRTASDVNKALKVMAPKQGEVWSKEFAKGVQRLEVKELLRPFNAYERELKIRQEDIAEKAWEAFSKPFLAKGEQVGRAQRNQIRKLFSGLYGEEGLRIATAGIRDINRAVDNGNKQRLKDELKMLNEAQAMNREFNKERKQNYRDMLTEAYRLNRELNQRAKDDDKQRRKDQKAMLAEAYQLNQDFNQRVRDLESQRRRDQKAMLAEAYQLNQDFNQRLRDSNRDRLRAERDMLSDALRMNRDYDKAISDGIRRRDKAEKKELKDRERRATKTKQMLGTIGEQMKFGINLRLGQMAPVLGLVATTAAPLAAALRGVAVGFVALTSAATQAAAAVGIAGVAALVAFGQAAGVAVFGMQGFTDALKATDNMVTKLAAGLELTQADVNAYDEAMAKLSPSARAVANTLSDVNAALTETRQAVQERLFAGMADDIREVAGLYLPILKARLGETADVLNKTGQKLADFAKRSSTMKALDDVLAGNVSILEEMLKVVVPLADAGLKLFRAFQPLGMVVAQYASAWAKAVDKTVSASAKSGGLADIMVDLADALRTIFGIAGDLGRALGGMFKATLEPGKMILGMFADLVDRFSEWVNSVGGQSTLAAWAWEAIPILKELGGLVGDIGRMFGDLADAGDAREFVAQVRTIIPPLSELLTQLSASGAAGDFAAAIGRMLQALVDLNAGGILSDTIKLIASLLTTVVGFVNSVPGLNTALRTLISFMLILKGIGLALTLTQLSRIPALAVGLLGAARAMKAFTLAALGMEVVGSAGKVGLALRAAGPQVIALGVALANTARQALAATGLMNGLRVAVIGVSSAIAFNPIGAILVGIGLLVTAFYTLGSSADENAVKVTRLNNELAKVGAHQVAQEIEDSLAGLKAKVAEIESTEMTFFDGLTEEGKKARAALMSEMDQIKAASAEMAQVYGGNVEAIIAQTRAMGVGAEVSSAEMTVAMKNIIKAHNGVPVSAEVMAKTLANIYGVVNKNYGVAAEGMAAISAEIAMGYDQISEAALISAENQIVALQLAAKATGKTGIASSLKSALYSAQLGFIRFYRASRPKSTGGGGGGGIGGVNYDNFVASAGAAGKKAGKKTAAGYLSTLTPALQELTAEYLLGKSAKWMAVGKNISYYLAKGITSGTKNLTKVSKYILKKFPKDVKKLQKLVKAYNLASSVYDPKTGKKQGLEFWKDRLDEIRDFRQQAFESLTAGRNLVNYFGFIPTPQEVQLRLNDILSGMRNFTNGLKNLQAKGLDPELAKDWLMAGADTAGNLVTGLQNATPAQIAALNATFRQIGKEATATTDAQAKKYFGIGEATVVGIIKGIEGTQAALIKSIDAVIDAAIKAAKKKLGIKSPSTIFAGFGLNTMAGYIEGINSMQSDTITAVDKLYTDVTKVPPATLAMPTAPSAGYATPNTFAGSGVTPMMPAVNVRVFIGDTELKGIVRTEIQQGDSARARMLLAGRRAGG